MFTYNCLNYTIYSTRPDITHARKYYGKLHCIAISDVLIIMRLIMSWTSVRCSWRASHGETGVHEDTT